VSEDSLRRRGWRSVVRGAAAWALVHHAGMTGRGAAEVLGMGTGAAVSQQLAKWREAVLLRPEFRALQAQVEEKLSPSKLFLKG
jgi:hypothetical protein